MRELIVSLLLLLAGGASAGTVGRDIYQEQENIDARFSCHSLKDLQIALNGVVNEQQVYNANTGSDVWTNKSGCLLGQDFQGSRFTTY